MPSEENITILLGYGGAKKSSFEMSSKEFKEASLAIKNRAREKAYSKGLPICISRNGSLIAEYADGRIVVVSGNKK